MRRALTLVVALASTAALLLVASPAGSSPVAASDELYQTCGRVFADPHAYWPSPAQAPQRSPFAKGNAACAATDFVSYADMVKGLEYLEGLFPQFVEFYELERDFGDGSECTSSTSNQDLCSAGLPRQGVANERVKSDLYMIRLTDERVSNKGKKYFVFPLSIHGIERAGAEAGVRAAEDLATWAACEAGVAPAIAKCAQEGTIPHPLLETIPGESVRAGAALRQSAVYFVFPNPDGWRRGDPDNLARFYQRYNGNGVDLNRDWPTIGYTFRPYTPWSEPETRGLGEVLKGIRQTWDGGIDLHGQLVDSSFSFTLLGASERNYAKDQRILQTVKGAWADAEKRFAWASAYIKPNDASPDDPRMYGVQWGTVWDTIDYTTTGSLGDWIDSPLGLGADGIDNEMSFSHLSNCGVGSCYVPDFEQLHVDGNKSLIYAMVHYGLEPEDTTFELPAGGKVGYVTHDRVLSNPGSKPAKDALGPQDPISGTLAAADYTYEFEVLGPTGKGGKKRARNGGLEAKISTLNVQGIGGGSLASLVLERYRTGEETPQADNGCGEGDDAWEEVNRYFNQSSVYLQSGQAVHANSPLPGLYRVCLAGDIVSQLAAAGASVPVEITFSAEQAWADPGQRPYSVTNMKLFENLKANVPKGQLVPVDAGAVLSGAVDLSQFRSLVIADEALPGYSEAASAGAAQDDIVHEPPTRAAATAPCA
ncbi:MAG: hypothetical protein M3168_06240, partial [Actinomycetota bacterium]|nr:hypothetical protein [Actinomycetota bacterium]